MSGPLEGIKVLDLSQFISGPWCGTLLSTQGAEVVKVEPPGMGEAMRLFTFFEKKMFPLFTHLNLNKKSITLNLREKEGQDILKRLVKEFDILIENFAPGIMENKWNLDYKTVLKPLNPRLIYGKISGYGFTGLEEYCKRTAFDIVIQAASGFMDALGLKEGPPRLPISDYSAGNVMAAGISQALYYREKTDKGQFIDLSMLDLMYSMNIRAQVREYIPQAKNRDPVSQILPTYNQYPTKDGKSIVIVTITEKQFQRLMDVIGKPELKKDKRFKTAVKRMDHIELLDEILRSWTKEKTRDEIVEILDKHRIPCSPVNTVDEVRNHPQLRARGMYYDKFDFSKYNLEKGTVPGVILRFSESPGEVRSKAPELGENNLEIYGEILNYSDENIKELKGKGII
jgi:crotonobetainyl-CoA:carnitine CoA-transferase CaiB-like acyl-CoA transferase